jgi:hypothetical protein
MNNPDKEDRRKHYRFPFRKEILIDGTGMCTSMDISEGGLYVSTIQFYKQNSVIDITIPFQGEKLTVKGQVTYCHPGIGMGIKFIELNDEQRKIINAIIDRILNL